ncbi:hypothetical protein EJB05_42190, partial [Eragrostis curvula]
MGGGISAGVVWRGRVLQPGAPPPPTPRPTRATRASTLASGSPWTRCTTTTYECRLFVNVATGRFVRKDMPMLRNYFVVAGAAGGQLVLAERSPPHAARILNPFTGGMIRFEAPVPSSEMEIVAHIIGSSPPTLVLVCGKSGAIYHANPDDKCFYFHVEKDRFSNSLMWTTLVCGIYAAAREDQGSFASRLSPAVNKIRRLVKSLSPDHFSDKEIDALTDDFVVESEGETLIVFKLRRGMKVFKLDTVTDMVQPVKDLGNRALFVSDSMCLSIDASKFPSVVPNCIYHIVVENISALDFGVCVYSLKDKNEVTLSLGTPSFDSRSAPQLPRLSMFEHLNLGRSTCLPLWPSNRRL